jgi:hypothetical protein
MDAESSRGELLDPLNTFGSLDSGEERRSLWIFLSIKHKVGTILIRVREVVTRALKSGLGK